MVKSTWMVVSLRTVADRSVVMSWFGMLGEGALPYEAAILCDNKTDREKKIRVRAIDGKRRVELSRTLGGKTYTIKRVVIGDAEGT